MKNQHIKYFFLIIGAIGFINIENQLYSFIKIPLKGLQYPQCATNLANLPDKGKCTIAPYTITGHAYCYKGTAKQKHTLFKAYYCGKQTGTKSPYGTKLKRSYVWQKSAQVGGSVAGFAGVIKGKTFITTIRKVSTGILQLTVNDLSTSQHVSTMINSTIPVASLQLYQTKDDLGKTNVKFAIVNRAMKDTPITVATVKFDSEAFTLTTVKEPVPFSSFAFHLARLFNTCVAVDQELV